MAFVGEWGGEPRDKQRMLKERKRDTKTVIQSIALREEEHFERDLREGGEGQKAVGYERK